MCTAVQSIAQKDIICNLLLHNWVAVSLYGRGRRHHGVRVQGVGDSHRGSVGEGEGDWASVTQCR